MRPPEEPTICNGCGILADASRPSCATCGATYTTPRLRGVPQPGGGYWAAVRATFTCNACRFDVPLNHFEVGDGVVCTRCGLEQRFDPSKWRMLVDVAHAVGDLGAPPPEGRFPDPEVRIVSPFPDLGARSSWAGEREYQASPGNPLCGSCKAPRVVLARRDRSLEVGCSRCGDKRTYEVPPTVRVKSLAGVLADEHEAGRSEAAVVDENGVVVLRCPNCSAPLSGVKQEDGVVTCGFCRVACRISSRTHARAGHKQAPVKTWWLYFEEPSADRRKLLNEARLDAARSAKREARDAHRARSKQGQPYAGGGAPSRPRRKSSETKALVPLIAVMLVAVVGGAAMWLVSVRKNKAEVEAQKAAAQALPGDDALLRYSFSMSAAEVSSLFGADARPGAKVKLKPGGVFKEVRLGGLGGPTYSLDLYATEKLDTAKVIARLEKLSPHRFRRDGAGKHEINAGRTVLRFDPRRTPMYEARVEVMTWVEGPPGVTAAEAFLAAAWNATLDGPEPTPAQLRLLNGTPLSDAAQFPTDTPVDKAKAAFGETFPTGQCKTATDLVSKATEMTCTADVDDAAIDELRYAWPSAAGARVQRLTLVRRKARQGERLAPDIGECLDAALGKGERKVVDFASGRAELSWPLGKRGDRASLTDQVLEIRARAGAKPDDPPDFGSFRAKIFGAIAGCGRGAQ